MAVSSFKTGYVFINRNSAFIEWIKWNGNTNHWQYDVLKRDTSDRQSAFAGLEKHFWWYIRFLSFPLNEFLQLEIKQILSPAQKSLELLQLLRSKKRSHYWLKSKIKNARTCVKTLFYLANIYIAIFYIPL